MQRHLNAYSRKWPRKFRRNGKARQGAPLFPDRYEKVCTKAGVTNTIRVAARRQGLSTKDPGGLFLHSMHAMRVAGSQAMSRAGLPEHTISLVARWGSAAVFIVYLHPQSSAGIDAPASQSRAGWMGFEPILGSTASAGSAAGARHRGRKAQRCPTEAPVDTRTVVVRVAARAATGRS